MAEKPAPSVLGRTHMQTVIEKYVPLIEAVNRYVAHFNEFLMPDHRLRVVDPADSNTFSIVADTPWNSRWPGSGYTGVFVFGLCDEKNSSRIAAYVGRASFRNLEHNILPHIHRRHGDRVYAMQSGSDMFHIEVLMVVRITSGWMRSMACALEEHIVKLGLNGIHVVNGLDTRPII